jgi:hypothetical protein
MEYHQAPVLFTKESDIVTAAVAKVAPEMKFLGLGCGVFIPYCPHPSAARWALAGCCCISMLTALTGCG